MRYQMPWDENAFQQRIMTAATALGMSERDVMRKAARPGDTFDKPPATLGRTYNVIEAIARAVGLSVCEAVGEKQTLSIPLLEKAVDCATEAVGDRHELLPDAIVSAYDVLAQREHEGKPIDESALSTLVAMLRSRGRWRV